MCSIIGGAAGITESACGARCAMTLDQLGAKMRCKKCGKRPERYYAAKQERHAGVRSKLVELSNANLH